MESALYTVLIHSLFRILKLTRSQSLARNCFKIVSVSGRLTWRTWNSSVLQSYNSWIKTVRAHFPWRNIYVPHWELISSGLPNTTHASAFSEIEPRIEADGNNLTKPCEMSINAASLSARTRWTVGSDLMNFRRLTWDDFLNVSLELSEFVFSVLYFRLSEFEIGYQEKEKAQLKSIERAVQYQGLKKTEITFWPELLPQIRWFSNPTCRPIPNSMVANCGQLDTSSYSITLVPYTEHTITIEALHNIKDREN